MKKQIPSTNVWILGLILVAATISPLGSQSSGGTPRLVSTEWLEANLSGENLRLVDARSDIRDYWQAHIAGAVYLDTAVLRWPDRGAPAKLLPAPALALLLGEMGIKEDTMVVAYYDKNGYPPFYFLWALDYIGHQKFALLEDGIERWRREGRPLSQDYPKIKPVSYRLPAGLRTEIRATLDDVLKAVKGGAMLLDVRPDDLYNGGKGAWKRKGHIKGALSHFWASDLLNDGSWRGEEELLAAYRNQGITPDKNIIIYCGQGQMGALTYFSLRHILGYPNVKLYDGGFSEWSVREDLPVEPKN